LRNNAFIFKFTPSEKCCDFGYLEYVDVKTPKYIIIRT
jgi:hypothetical protein